MENALFHRQYCYHTQDYLDNYEKYGGIYIGHSEDEEF
jgi:hypothetical protein